MLSHRILNDVKYHIRGAVCQRNIGIVAPMLQKASDPIQQLFVDKLREYKQKSAGGTKLVDPTPALEKELSTELEKAVKQYGGGEPGVDMIKFPTFKFTDPAIDPINMENAMPNADINDKSKETKLGENEWMVRPCDVYEEEYKDCRSIKARFHQYFIYGKMIDCTQWKHDLDNCCKWMEKKDVDARNALIQSEIARRLERLKAHYGNNVWEKRKAPPEEWSKPLPEEFLREYENSYLNIKSKELKGEIAPVLNDSYCVIL